LFSVAFSFLLLLIYKDKSKPNKGLFERVSHLTLKMGNNEGTMSYTLSYDDSGFSDVATSSLEASYTKEYEQGLKSMFLNEQPSESSSTRPITPVNIPRQTSTPRKLPFKYAPENDADKDFADEVMFGDESVLAEQGMAITAQIADQPHRRPSLVKSRSIGIGGSSTCSSLSSSLMSSRRGERTYSSTNDSHSSCGDEEELDSVVFEASGCSCEQCARGRTTSVYSVSQIYKFILFSLCCLHMGFVLFFKFIDGLLICSLI
jgi:hypothetical protein